MNLSRAWALINRKRLAYQFTFKGPDQMIHREGRVVLDDLRKFCSVDKPGIVVSPVTRVTDPYATAYRAGARDVYERIVKYLNLEENEHARSSIDPE